MDGRDGRKGAAMQISGVGKGLNVYDAYKYMYQWYWYGLVSIRSILYVRNTESSHRPVVRPRGNGGDFQRHLRAFLH